MPDKELNCPCTDKKKCNFHTVYENTSFGKSISRDVIQKVIQEYNE